MAEPAADLYVLGLLHIAGDMEGTPVLTRQQVTTTGWMFAEAILDDTQVESGDDDTYFKFRLSPKENPIPFGLFVGDNLRPLIDEIQFGYYHHRAIFKFCFRSGTSLPALRNARAQAAQIARERCFDAVVGKVIPPADEGLRIEYIYSYSLLVFPQGINEVATELREIRARGYDEIFTVRSTTFGLQLPEKTALINARRHYVRISVPSTVIYLDGDEIGSELFGNVVDAIYYGGLYRKAQLDYELSQKTGKDLKPRDRWTNDLLLSVFSILVDSVRANERSDLSVQLARIGLVIALAALIISILTRFS